jgi:hypothetical protein
VTANRGGQFWFPSLADGQYVLSATRAGYAQTIYGQWRHGGSAQLIEVKGDSTSFAELRLLKLGAISGRVVDENRVGLAGNNVIAYQSALPLRQVTSAKTDDRGIFRLFGLLPGRYYVRSSAHELEDGFGLLPTFSPGNAGTSEARVITAALDTEVTDIDFQPLPGKLLSVGGTASGCPTGERFVKVTLSSDTGRREIQTPCESAFTFDVVAPGYHELLLEPGAMPGTVALFASSWLTAATMPEPL